MKDDYEDYELYGDEMYEELNEEVVPDYIHDENVIDNTNEEDK